MSYIDYSQYELNKGGRASDEQGNFVADVLPAKTGDKLLVAPRSGATVRPVAELALALAKANTSLEVGYDFSGQYYNVTKDDTLTAVIIRHDEAGARKPGSYLDLIAKGSDTLEGQVSTKAANTKLFDVVIDAIRLSRENDGKAIEFKFNNHAFSVRANDDAEELERMVPQGDRVTNVPPPRPPAKAEPYIKVGGFKITGSR